MEYHEIKLLLDVPALRLLRGQNSAMVLGFLHHAFKRKLRVAIPESELRARLDSYLDDLRETDPLAYSDSSADYLNRWCEDTHGFLRKYYGEEKQEPLFELTTGSEKALVWLESLGQTGFVGTESRLQGIFNGLDEILKFGTRDTEQRIRQLKEEAERIQDEIDCIRATGMAKTFTPVQINERFARILSTARELLGDFRLVEDNFKRIAQYIAEQHAIPGVTKGAIVGHMLDSHDTLRHSAQGQSFFAFWELLLAPDQQQRFEETLEQVLALEGLEENLRHNSLLQQLMSHLLLEGEKVVSSHQRMSVSLRRVLDTANLQDRRRVLDLIREIQTAALGLRDRPPEEDCFFAIEDFPAVFATMSRPLWQAPESPVFEGIIEVTGGEFGLEDLRRFRNLPQITLLELKKNVEACLKQEECLTLQQVLDRFPPHQGMLEVLGYLIIASEEPRHYIAEEFQTIELPSPSRQRWRVPQVLFCKA